jgi:outer membrane lipoprotein-sorting protein
VALRGTALLLCAALSLLGACGARTPKRPEGPGAADPAAVQTFESATRQCAGLKTLTAEIRLSGRAGGERLRGTLHAGLAAPGALRFEAVAPFGPPVFVLAGRNNRATLLLPRDDLVLSDVALADVLERLTALALDADAVRLILSGCLTQGAPATDGRSWDGGWFAVSLGADTTAYLQQRNGTAIVAAADYGSWLIDYGDHLNGWPRTVRIRSREPGRVDATARLDQVEINPTLDDRAFTVDVPADAERITLDDLRAIAPLRGSN